MACVYILDYASDGGRDYYGLCVLFRLRLRWRRDLFRLHVRRKA